MLTPIIINLTQHAPSPEQIKAGVTDLRKDARAELITLLTFDEIPSKEEMARRAERIAVLALDEFYSYGLDVTSKGMIGGAPFFMSALETALRKKGIGPVYAFSVRESVEVTGPDGSVTKTAVFRHKGFVEV